MKLSSAHRHPSYHSSRCSVDVVYSCGFRQTHTHTHNVTLAVQHITSRYTYTYFSSKYYLKVDKLHFWLLPRLKSSTSHYNLQVLVESQCYPVRVFVCLFVICSMLVFFVCLMFLCVGMEMSPLSMANMLLPVLTRQIRS